MSVPVSVGGPLFAGAAPVSAIGLMAVIATDPHGCAGREDRVLRNGMKGRIDLSQSAIGSGVRFPRRMARGGVALLVRRRGMLRRAAEQGMSGPQRRLALAAVVLTGALLAGLLSVRHSPPPAPQAPAVKPTAAAETQAAETDAAPAPPPPWQTLTVRPGDTLSALFVRAGLDATQWVQVMALGKVVQTLETLHPGEQLRLRSDGAQGVAELRYAADDLHILEVSAGADGLHAHMRELHPVVHRTTVTAEVDQTLRGALLDAGLDNAQVAELVNIFHWRVDFRREIRRGTRVSLAYDTRKVAARELPPGPIVAAELVLHDRTLRAFRYASADGEVGYYDAHGMSMHPTLLRTPVRYTRISSPFSLHRFDPVYRVWRPHYGVDLAANIGTPVHAAGDGRITYIGHCGGYGNLVKIRNFGPYSTRYAHLHRFAAGLHRGSRVRQGQVIGYVGQSGAATGPHLHFEIRVNGTPRNPLKVHLPAGPPLDARERRRFKAAIRPLVALLQHTADGAAQLARGEMTANPVHRAM